MKGIFGVKQEGENRYRSTNETLHFAGRKRSDRFDDGSFRGNRWNFNELSNERLRGPLDSVGRVNDESMSP